MSRWVDFARAWFRNYPPIMTAGDAGKRLGLCTIMIGHGDITSTKIGRQYLILKESLKGYCKRNGK